jgi:hypothetical protein
MKKFLNIALAMGLALVLTSTAVQAVELGFVPPAQEVPVGTSVSVDVVISGLGDFTSPSLGAFDLDIAFDPSILSLSSVVFGPFLGDISLAEAIASDTPGVGTVNVFEVSFLLDFELDALQPGSFPLVTLNFDTLNSGTSPLTITSATLSDAFGYLLSYTASEGSVTVTPEPGTWVLMLSGLAGLLGIWRKRAVAQA